MLLLGKINWLEYSKKIELDINHSFQWILDAGCSLQPSWTYDITFAITSLSLSFSSCGFFTVLLLFWDLWKSHKGPIFSRGLLIMHSSLIPENPPSLPSLRIFSSFSVASSPCGNSCPISMSWQIRFAFPLSYVKGKQQCFPADKVKAWYMPGSTQNPN